MGTNTTESSIVYLLEDALDLWTAVLEYSPTMTNELMQLFNNMPSLLGKKCTPHLMYFNTFGIFGGFRLFD